MKRLLAATASLIMVAVILVGCTPKQTDTKNNSSVASNSSTSAITVTIEMDINGEVTKKEYATELKTVEELLIEKSSELGMTLTDSEYGKFVSGANNYTADSAKNEFIEFLVNGKSSEVGIAGVTIVDKDIYTFKLSTF